MKTYNFAGALLSLFLAGAPAVHAAPHQPQPSRSESATATTQVYCKDFSNIERLVVNRSEVGYVFPSEPGVPMVVPDHVYKYAFVLVSPQVKRTLWTLKVPLSETSGAPCRFDIFDTHYDKGGLAVVYKLSDRNGDGLVHANIVRPGVEDANVKTPLFRSALIGEDFLPEDVLKRKDILSLSFKSASFSGSIAAGSFMVTIKSKTEDETYLFDFAYKGGKFVEVVPGGIPEGAAGG